MYCPKCRAEFVEGISRCQACDTELVSEAPADDVFASPEAMARALASKELEAVLVGNHVALIEAQKRLAQAYIASVIAGEPEAEVGPGMHPRFFLMVEQDKLETVRDFVTAEWQKGLEIEGLMLSTGETEASSTSKAASENGLNCPACGAKVPDTAPECPDCGLFLGNPDQAE